MVAHYRDKHDSDGFFAPSLSNDSRISELIKYLGSKRLLIPGIRSVVDSIADVNFLDSLPATDLSELYTESGSTTVSDLNAFEATEEGDANVVPETNLYHTFSSDLDEPSDTPVTEPSGLSRSDDRDIILIDDAADDGASLAKPKQSVYGQLFAKLRRN